MSLNMIEPLYLGGTTVRIDGVYIAVDQVDRIGPNSVLLLEDEAESLRDWLNKALGEEPTARGEQT